MRGVNTTLAGVSRADTTSNILNRALKANVSCNASQQKQPLKTNCFQFLFGPPISRKQRAFTPLTASLNLMYLVNVSASILRPNVSAPFRSRGTSPAPPTHRHSAPRRAAPSSEMSVLKTGENRESVCNNHPYTL